VRVFFFFFALCWFHVFGPNSYNISVIPPTACCDLLASDKVHWPLVFSISQSFVASLPLWRAAEHVSESEAYFRVIVITSSYKSHINAVSECRRRVFTCVRPNLLFFLEANGLWMHKEVSLLTDRAESWHNVSNRFSLDCPREQSPDETVRTGSALTVPESRIQTNQFELLQN